MAKSNSVLNGASPSAASIEDLAAQINILKNDLSALTQTLAQHSTNKAEDVKQTAADKAAELHAAGRDKVVEAQLHAEEFVRTQPATSLGLAAGLGFVVGMLVTARR